VVERVIRIVSILALTGCVANSREPGACDVWRAGPALLDQREGADAFLLPDGRVMLVGGHYRYSDGKAVNTSELLDLEAGTSTFTGEFAIPRNGSGNGATVQLLDGSILSATPWIPPDGEQIPAELWHPSSGTWTPTMPQLQGSGPGVVLADGRVLVAGGIDWSTVPGGVDRPLDRAELWDPATQRWTLTERMASARTGHALVVIGDGALSLGGFATYPGASALLEGERFDPVAGRWSTAAPLVHPIGTIAELAGDRLLSTGGAASSGGFQEVLATSQLYDLATDRWRAVAPMLVARAAHSMTALRDGRVLVTGGAREAFRLTTSSTEIYDPASDTWIEAATMGAARRHHNAVLLPTGEVLVAGGDPSGWFSSEIYTPCE
jgi:large repetitive protein